MATYPIPAFRFSVDWGGTQVGFSEVTGLTGEVALIEYRTGNSLEASTIKMPGLRKYSNITLKRGVMAGDNEFFAWLMTVGTPGIQRRTLIIKLLDEASKPVMVWTAIKAFPVKVEGPQLKASGNDVAIESIEIAHEGLSVVNESAQT